MKLSRADRTSWAKDNYHKFKSEFHENMKRGNTKPPISDSQKRAGSGKGDMPRLVDKEKFDKNYSAIKWKSKKK